MQHTNVEADMSEDPNSTPMTDRDLASILQGRAQQVAEGDADRETVLVELLQLVARETPNVEQRVDTIGTRGRVSFGRDRAGEFGTALFVPDDVLDAAELEEQLEDARGEA
jgi:hypothetical protein